ncbi:hypothetical protein ACLB2K_050620 [Fragaria x ananassa]
MSRIFIQVLASNYNLYHQCLQNEYANHGHIGHLLHSPAYDILLKLITHVKTTKNQDDPDRLQLQRHLQRSNKVAGIHKLYGPVWYSCGFQNKLAVANSENKQLTSKAAECLVNWLFVSAVNGRSRGKLFGKLAF